jgi:hypothetical protein
MTPPKEPIKLATIAGAQEKQSNGIIGWTEHQLLEYAKMGGISGIALAVTFTDGAVSSTYTSSQLAPLLGAIAVLQSDIVDDINNGNEEE